MMELDELIEQAERSPYYRLLNMKIDEDRLVAKSIITYFLLSS